MAQKKLELKKYAKMLDDDLLAERLTEFCKRENIFLDFETGTGLPETFYLVNDAGNDISPIFQSEDFDKDNRNAEAQAHAHMMRLANALKNSNTLYIYKPGEDYPRPLTYDANAIAKQLTLGERADVLPEKPKRPSIFMRIAHFFNRRAYAKEIEDYPEKLRNYQAAVARKERLAAHVAPRKAEAAERQQKRLEKHNQRIAEQVKEVERQKAALTEVLKKQFGKAYLDGKPDINAYILINGKSLDVLLSDAFRRKYPNPDDWHNNYCPFSTSTQGRDAALELLANAIANKNLVECYPPDKAFRLPEQPVNLSLPGVPTDAFAEARTAALAQMKKIAYFDYLALHMATLDRGPFFEGWVNAHKGSTSSLKTPIPANDPELKNPLQIPQDRTILTSYAIGKLLLAGKSMEEIFDPDMLKEEKDAAGREILDAVAAGNEDILGELNYKIRRHIADRLDELTQNIDVSDPNQLFSEKNRDLGILLEIAFDMDQEEKSVRNGLKRYLSKMQEKYEYDPKSEDPNCRIDWSKEEQSMTDRINHAGTPIKDACSFGADCARLAAGNLAYSKPNSLMIQLSAKLAIEKYAEIRTAQSCSLTGAAEAVPFGRNLSAYMTYLYSGNKDFADMLSSKPVEIARVLQGGALSQLGNFDVDVSDPELPIPSFAILDPAIQAPQPQAQPIAPQQSGPQRS